MFLKCLRIFENSGSKFKPEFTTWFTNFEYVIVYNLLHQLIKKSNMQIDEWKRNFNQHSTENKFCVRLTHRPKIITAAPEAIISKSKFVRFISTPINANSIGSITCHITLNTSAAGF